MIKLQKSIDDENDKFLNSNPRISVGPKTKTATKITKKPIQRRKTTIPRAPRFATSNRMQNRRESLLQQREEELQLQEIKRLKKLKKERLQSEKRLKAMRKSIKKKQKQLLLSQYSTPVLSKGNRKPNRNRAAKRSMSFAQNDTDSIRQKSKSLSKRSLRRSRSQPHFMRNTQSKSARIRTKSSKSQTEEAKLGNKGSKKGTKQSLIRSRSVAGIESAKKSGILDQDLDESLIKELNDIKEKLRFGKQINIPRSKSLERIQSRYAQRKDNGAKSKLKRRNCGISVVIPAIPPLKIERDVKIIQDIELREKQMNKRLLLTPIHEMENKNNNLEDLAIDEILTEDACTISDHYEVNGERKEESASLEVDQQSVDTLMDEAREFVFSPLKLVKKQDDEITDGADIANNLKDKFKKLDNLFIEIAEKIDGYDDSSSFDLVSNLTLS